MFEQGTIFDAIARRDTGIRRAGDHADAEHERWVQTAAAAIVAYAASHGPFLIEDVREARRDISDPPDARAWGAAARRAAATGLVRRVGYAPSRSSNLSPKVLWCAN